MTTISPYNKGTGDEPYRDYPYIWELQEVLQHYDRIPKLISIERRNDREAWQDLYFLSFFVHLGNQILTKWPSSRETYFVFVLSNGTLKLQRGGEDVVVRSPADGLEGDVSNTLVAKQLTWQITSLRQWILRSQEPSCWWCPERACGPPRCCRDPRRRPRHSPSPIWQKRRDWTDPSWKEPQSQQYKTGRSCHRRRSAPPTSSAGRSKWRSAALS